ncbi:hypothetical protein DRF65_13140 [Chryseobacterium pennae]|uniref:Lipoprotein n=1 Tax=Chryseobacterium pennae TaxID=2258962 RepID=A0A3D9C8Q4_9FLAO|nr:hypothetical protein [Chryseobacterium pennae]REC61966.1 hypothetical protein DRF65_13140 [Chryseobacterium pennae]
MQINRIFNLVLIIPLFMVGCKKNIISESQDINDKIEKEKIYHNSDTTNIPENNNLKLSLVLSCGSGCAMTYNATKITQTGLNIKVIFTVDMYIDEVISDTYDEAYIFSYDDSYRLKKIVKVGDEEESFLETQSVDNQKSFTDFAKELVKKNISIIPYENCFEETSIKLPYSTSINYKSAKYNYLKCNDIKGLQKLACEKENIRYIPLPTKNDINIILIPQDCGDFSYRFYLVTIKNNSVVGNLYVEGEWQEPEDDSSKEVTTFSLDNKYNLQVKTKTNTSLIIKNYIISSNGEIVKK